MNVKEFQIKSVTQNEFIKLFEISRVFKNSANLLNPLAKGLS